MIQDTQETTAVKVTRPSKSYIYPTTLYYFLYTVCLPGTYGSNCAETCDCMVGSCHHITGECICPPDHLGTDCSHGKTSDIKLWCVQTSVCVIDCSGAPECGVLGRGNCSLDTPENTCGLCRAAGYSPDWGNSSCVVETSTAGPLQYPLPTPSLSSTVTAGPLQYPLPTPSLSSTATAGPLQYPLPTPSLSSTVTAGPLQYPLQTPSLSTVVLHGNSGTFTHVL